MSHNPLDKIQALDAIEKEIIQCLQSAGKTNSFKVHMHCLTFKCSIHRTITTGVGERENQPESC